MTAKAYQMPVSTELAARTGPRLWKKTVLKAGHIKKGDIELDVDRSLLDQLVSSFTAGAKDQVQFQLAGAKNEHNDLPENFRGELLDLSIGEGDTLEATFGVTARGDALLTENPRLGASVSFIDVFERADGRNFGPTLLHVAGTHDPEIAGLGDWQRADLSAAKSDVKVYDFTGATDGPANGGQDNSNKKGDGMPALKDLTEAQLAKLLALIDDKPAGGEGGDVKVTDDDAKKIAADVDNVDKKTVDADADADDKKDDKADDAANTPDKQLVDASASDKKTIELAARVDSQALELAALRRERDTARYQQERDQFAQEYGIPPRITDLCAKWLTGAHVIQLSASEAGDPGADIRKMLKEFGQVAKLLDLSGPIGSSHDFAAQDAEKTDRDTFLERARTSGFAR